MSIYITSSDKKNMYNVTPLSSVFSIGRSVLYNNNQLLTARFPTLIFCRSLNEFESSPAHGFIFQSYCMFRWFGWFSSFDI